MNSQALTRWLASAGALPFIACALLPIASIDRVPGLGAVSDIAAAYGLTIASFMAGVHWGTALNVSSKLPINLFITSNVVAVAAWLSFLLGPVALTLAVLAALFLYLLFVDYRLSRGRMIDPGYWRTRLYVTVTVVLSLSATAYVSVS